MTSLLVHELFKGKLRIWQVSLSSDDYLTMSLVQGEPLIYEASTRITLDGEHTPLVISSQLEDSSESTGVDEVNK